MCVHTRDDVRTQVEVLNEDQLGMKMPLIVMLAAIINLSSFHVPTSMGSQQMPLNSVLYI